MDEGVGVGAAVIGVDASDVDVVTHPRGTVMAMPIAAASGALGMLGTLDVLAMLARWRSMYSRKYWMV